MTCVGTVPAHEFEQDFLDPVDWTAVGVALALTNQRCAEHLDRWYDPNCDWE